MRTLPKTKTAIYRDESRLFYAVLSLVMIAATLYAYFLSASVVHVVMRKEVDAKIAEAATALSVLDADYIELQHALSADIATQKGFVAAPKKLFVDKTQGTLVLSRN